MSNKIVILSDSTCDLSLETIKDRKIEIVPLKVCFNTNTYLDGVEIDTVKMYELYNQSKILPKTAGVTCEEFMNLFKKLIGENNDVDVIYTGIGSKLSSTYQQALLAKQNLDENLSSHIYLVDSNNLSTGIGLLVLKMCDMRDMGYDALKIFQEANKIVPCIRAQFSVKDLTFLHKGGRCSGTTRFFGTMLRIHPILRVFNGQIILSEKSFGNYEKALKLQIEDISKNINNVDTDYLFITHSMADEEATFIYNNLPSSIKDNFKNIMITKAGCVISSHCGKHTIGILYIKKEPLLTDK